MKNRIFILSCILTAVILFSLLSSYGIGNSITLNPLQTDLSKYDLNEDEFSGDAIPIIGHNYYFY
jgi:hypothetical protein